jgi:hypothetical protein
MNPVLVNGSSKCVGELRQSSNPQTKGRSIMGDRSPKSVHKQSSQKQAKADKAKLAKQQSVFAKQSSINKK